MSTPAIPDPKSPSKDMIEAAQKERARRAACHGDWTPCTDECETKDSNA